MDIRTKRAYEEPSEDDGVRVLVDRIWPRGVSKEDARLDEWLKDVAPSDGLRKWFDHDPERWDEFRERYFDELDEADGEVEWLLDAVDVDRLTLVYGAKDEEHNNARALAQYLEQKS